jgi:hypothetical protein
MSECGEQFQGPQHVHQCDRREGHYDDHLCGECEFDWLPGAQHVVAEARRAGLLNMDLLKQVRKGLDDIRATLTDESGGGEKAVYQLDLLRKMIDAPPDRQHPWSYYQPQVDEEFGATSVGVSPKWGHGEGE